MPTEFRTRRHELFWNYELPKGKHKVVVKLLNPSALHDLRINDVIVYNDQPNTEGNQKIYRFGQPKQIKP